jgi:hypothetical protein
MDLLKPDFAFNILLLLLRAGSLGAISRALCPIVSDFETASHSSQPSTDYQQFTVLI